MTEKKKPADLTTEEAFKKLFPKKVREQVKKSTEESKKGASPAEITIKKKLNGE